MTQLSINAISNGSLKAPSLKADQSTLTLIRSTIAQRPCTIIIALLAIVLSLGGFGATLASSLELTRDSLIEGRLWTILTGPLLHVSFQHLVFDVLGLLIVGWIFLSLRREKRQASAVTHTATTGTR